MQTLGAGAMKFDVGAEPDEGTYDHDVPEPTLEKVAPSVSSSSDAETTDATADEADETESASTAATTTSAEEETWAGKEETESETDGLSDPIVESASDQGGGGGGGGGMFDVPQSVCPGKPSKKSLNNGAPKGNKAAIIKEKLIEVTNSVAYSGYGGNAERRNLSCVYLTSSCADPETGMGRGVMRKLGFNPNNAASGDLEKFNKLRKNLPNLTEGALGTCAIVANSDNLLKSTRGSEIDAHDTVFRHNTPTRGFEKNVGKKTGVVIVKSNYKAGGGGAGKAQGSGAKPSVAYMLLKNVDQLPKSLKVDGMPALLRAGGAHPIARLRRELYGLYGASGRKHPSGGWARPLNVLASKLCTRVDLYGFSGDMGGKYFAKAVKVRPAHEMGFEHWTYRYLQSQGKLCVYGD